MSIHHHTQAMTTKTALITGAAKRIGAGIARDLHDQGMDVIIHYHTSESQAHALAGELNDIRPQSAIAVKADLRIIDSYNDLVESVMSFKERLDVLVNNASMFYPTPITSTTVDQWMDIMGTNIKAPYFLIQSLYPQLKSASGCIINITDIYGELPLSDHPVYSASKAGLIMLTRALAKELAPEIRVNAISPGAIIWPDETDKAHQMDVLNNTLVNRTGSVQDITDTVRFLIESDFITAQVINVDGGRLV